MKKLYLKSKFFTAIVSVAIISGVAAGVVCILLAQMNNSANTATGEVALADTPDLGACQILTPEALKNATLSEGKITSIDSGTRVGIKSPANTNADACRYNFKSTISSNNTITVAAYFTPTLTTKDSAENATDNNWSEAAGTSPQIYFAEAKSDDNKNVVYFAKQPLGGVVLLLIMTQPADSVTYNKGEGLWYLASMASNANASVINQKSVQVTNSDTKTQGDAPEPPKNTKVEILKPDKN